MAGNPGAWHAEGGLNPTGSQKIEFMAHVVGATAAQGGQLVWSDVAGRNLNIAAQTKFDRPRTVTTLGHITPFEGACAQCARGKLGRFLYNDIGRQSQTSSCDTQ